MVDEIARLKSLLIRALPYIECQVEDNGYGFFPGGDPTKFIPDDDNTPEQLANWKEACKRWNEGNTNGEPSSHVPFTLGDSIVGHATVARLGMGAYQYIDEEARDIVQQIKELEAATDAQ